MDENQKRAHGAVDDAVNDAVLGAVNDILKEVE